MYTNTNVVDIDKVISLIATGRVVVRNVKSGQIYDVYGNIYDNVYNKKPTITFENNWNEQSYILYFNGKPAEAVDYGRDMETMPECQELVRVLRACIERYRVQNETMLPSNGIMEYRKNMFSKFLDKIRGARTE